MDYYVARWYDPMLGHFTQADSIIPEPGKSQSFDRYAYVMNNPLRYVDPSGHDVGCALLIQHGYSREEVLEYSGYRTKGKEELAQIVLSNLNYVNKPNWNDLSDYERNALTDASMTEEVFNMSDYSANGSKGVVDIGGTIEDPVVWLTLFIALGIKAPMLFKGITSALFADCTTDGDCGIVKEIIVLGKYPNYINTAKDIGGKVFSMPQQLYESLSSAEQWELNKAFLDRAIRNGDFFYLASDYSEATGVYGRELKYLFDLGYSISLNQKWLIPPQ